MSYFRTEIRAHNALHTVGDQYIFDGLKETGVFLLRMIISHSVE